MTTIGVSDKGQVTLPAAARRKLGIQPSSRLEIEVGEREIILRPARTISDVRGGLAHLAVGKTTDWETMRNIAMEAVAAEVMSEGL
jgi:AbrB family looped-hinge helix DNA binding protein